MNLKPQRLVMLDNTLSPDQLDGVLYAFDEMLLETIVPLGTQEPMPFTEFETANRVERPRLLAPFFANQHERYDLVIVVANGCVFDLVDWLYSHQVHRWMLIRGGQVSIKPAGVSHPEFGLGEIERAWKSLEKPQRQRRVRQSHSLVGSAANYMWGLDATAFPTLLVPDIGCEWSLFPLTNVQFEAYWAAAEGAFDNAWYSDRLKRNMRSSFVDWTAHESLLMTDLLAVEAEAVTNWCDGILPSVLQWRTVYRWLMAQPATLPPPELRGMMHPAALAIWEGIFSQQPPKSMLELSLMTGGVTEWVREGGQFVGLGKPRPTFQRMLGDPLKGNPVRPIRANKRIRHFGMRVMYP